MSIALPQMVLAEDPFKDSGTRSLFHRHGCQAAQRSQNSYISRVPLPFGWKWKVRARSLPALSVSECCVLAAGAFHLIATGVPILLSGPQACQRNVAHVTSFSFIPFLSEVNSFGSQCVSSGLLVVPCGALGAGVRKPLLRV